MLRLSCSLWVLALAACAPPPARAPEPESRCPAGLEERPAPGPEAPRGFRCGRGEGARFVAHGPAREGFRDPDLDWVVAIGGYHHGRRDGLWRYERGYQTIAVGSYRDDERHGRWVFGRPARPSAAGSYHEGQLTGDWSFTCAESGVSACAGTFERGVQRRWSWRQGERRVTLAPDADGWSLTAHEGDALALRARTVEPEAPWSPTSYVRRPRAAGRFSATECAGSFETFHPNGQAQVVASCRDGAYDGSYTRLAEDGTVLETAGYAGGVRHGPRVRYREDASRELEEHHDRGLPAGTFRWLRPDGSVAREENYVDGKLEGTVATWHESGARASVRTYQLGARHGREQRWSEAGRLLLDGAWQHGRRVGRWRSFHGSGRPRSDGRYGDAGDIARCRRDAERALARFAQAKIGSPPVSLASAPDACEALLGEVIGSLRYWDDRGTLVTSIDATGKRSGPSLKLASSPPTIETSGLAADSAEVRKQVAMWRACLQRELRDEIAWLTGSFALTIDIDDGEATIAARPAPLHDETQICLERSANLLRPANSRLTVTVEQPIAFEHPFEAQARRARERARRLDEERPR